MVNLSLVSYMQLLFFTLSLVVGRTIGGGNRVPDLV